MTTTFDETMILLEAVEASVSLLISTTNDKDLIKAMKDFKIGDLVILTNLNPIVPVNRKIGILESIDGKSDGSHYVIKCFDGVRMSWCSANPMKIPRKLVNRVLFE